MSVHIDVGAVAGQRDVLIGGRRSREGGVHGLAQRFGQKPGGAGRFQALAQAVRSAGPGTGGVQGPRQARPALLGLFPQARRQVV